MWKRTGKHARRRFRVGPVFAFQAVMLALSAERELSAVTASQLSELAAGR